MDERFFPRPISSFRSLHSTFDLFVVKAPWFAALVKASVLSFLFSSTAWLRLSLQLSQLAWYLEERKSVSALSLEWRTHLNSAVNHFGRYALTRTVLTGIVLSRIKLRMEVQVLNNSSMLGHKSRIHQGAVVMNSVTLLEVMSSNEPIGRMVSLCWGFLGALISNCIDKVMVRGYAAVHNTTRAVWFGRVCHNKVHYGLLRSWSSGVEMSWIFY